MQPVLPCELRRWIVSKLVVSLALDRLTIHFNPTHVREPSETMSTSWSEIDKTDLVNFAQIRLGDSVQES